MSDVFESNNIEVCMSLAVECRIWTGDLIAAACVYAINESRNVSAKLTSKTDSGGAAL